MQSGATYTSPVLLRPMSDRDSGSSNMSYRRSMSPPPGAAGYEWQQQQQWQQYYQQQSQQQQQQLQQQQQQVFGTGGVWSTGRRAHGRAWVDWQPCL